MTTEELFKRIKNVAKEIAAEKNLSVLISDRADTFQMGAKDELDKSVYVYSYPCNVGIHYLCRAGKFSLSYRISDGKVHLTSYTIFPDDEGADIEAFLMPMKRLKNRIKKELKK